MDEQLAQNTERWWTTLISLADSSSTTVVAFEINDLSKRQPIDESF